MSPRLILSIVAVGLLNSITTSFTLAATGPYVDGRFQGRIAYSCDGNHNDPDDWAASPVTLAILAEAGLKDLLVHFDYNCILPLTDPEWEKTHAESVLGTAERYGFDLAEFFDCRKDRDGAVASIARAINESAADNPLYFIIAGPMEVPYLGIQHSEPAKRQFVYCISHSRWNDGFASKYRFTFNTRLASASAGSIRTCFDEPFTSDSARYDVEVRYFDAKNSRCRFGLFVNGVA